jgi:heme exporter protein B
MSGFGVLMKRELALAWGRGGGPLVALAFNLCAVTLLPLAAGASLDKLKLLAPGFSWVALALASLLSLERLFERDYEDGALDLLALGPAPLELVAAAKCFSQWVCTGLPLAVFAPVAATALGADMRLAPLTFVCALIGGLGFAFVGGIGAAVSLGTRAGGVLIAVIVLPLFTPLAIFGGGAIAGLAMGLDWTGGLLFLSAYSLAAVALGPFAMAWACRNALS